MSAVSPEPLSERALEEMWVAHDDPTRPLDPLVEFCDCLGCQAALRAQAERDPEFVIGLKTCCDRILVTVEYLVETMDGDLDLEALLYMEDDYVRSLFIPVEYQRMTEGARWWSLARHEDEAADGLRHLHRRKAMRQPPATAERRLQESVDGEQPTRTVLPPVPLSDAVANARVEHRGLIAAALRWSERQGTPLDPDHVALIAAVLADRCGLNPRSAAVWTSDRVNDLLAVDIGQWCSLARCRPPRDLDQSIWLFLGFLSDTGCFHPSSDPLAKLREPLADPAITPA